MYFRRTPQTKASLQNKSQIDSTRLVSTTQQVLPRRAHSPPNLKPALDQGAPAHHVGASQQPFTQSGEPFLPKTRDSTSTAHS